MRQVPDPTLEETFALSRLDWDEAARAPHRSIREETRALLRLRQAEVAPLVKSGFVGAQVSPTRPEALDVVWTFKAGRLRFTANFGDAETAFERGAERILWASRSAALDQGRVRLPAWTGAMLRSEPGVSEHDVLIEQVAALVGIAPGHTDAFGRHVETSAETRRAILSDSASNVETEDRARDSLAQVERLRRGPVPALVPVEAGQPARIPARLSPGTRGDVAACRRGRRHARGARHRRRGWGWRRS